MNEALKELRLKWELLKLALKIALMRLCGVDELVRKAFYEGWQMAHDNDFARLKREMPAFTGIVANVHVISDEQDLNEITHGSRCWRHVDEAWFNSDAEESV